MFAQCLPNPDNITIWGNNQGSNFQLFEVRLVRCRDRPTCRNDSEIDEFINKNGHIMILQNKIDYQREVYSEKVLDKYSDFQLISIQSDSRE